MSNTLKKGVFQRLMTDSTPPRLEDTEGFAGNCIAIHRTSPKTWRVTDTVWGNHLTTIRAPQKEAKEIAAKIDARLSREQLASGWLMVYSDPYGYGARWQLEAHPDYTAIQNDTLRVLRECNALPRVLF